MISDLPLILLFLVVGSMKPSEEKSAEGLSEASCELFEVGDRELMEFYSPNYPNKYQKHMDCLLILEAPEGYHVKVDFRDGFHMEPEMPDCKFDSLEVLDGPFGYSNYMGKYCGHEYPPELISTGRYLRLRFRTDSSAEYTGFRALYQYIPTPTELAVVSKGEYQTNLTNLMEGWANITDIESSLVNDAIESNDGIDYVWLIAVQPDWRIQLSFLTFTLSFPNECEHNFLDVFTNKTDIATRLHHFCGSMAEMVTSSGNVLMLRYVASPEGLKMFNSTKIEALFTAVKEKPYGLNCSDIGLYDCEDGNCISMDLKCNSRYNCRYRGDEDERICTPPETFMQKIQESYHLQAILALFFLILFGMCCAFFYHCIKKLIRDQRIIREQMQRSRDAKLEQLGKKTPAGAVVTPLVAVVGKGPDRHPAWPNPPKHDSNDEESSGSSSIMEERTVVEMREVEIQTRESLFHSPGSSPACSVPRTFKTFGYDDSEESSQNPAITSPASAAAAALLDPRATSLESTKSAPDVIMSH